MSVSPLPESESVLAQPHTIAAAPSLETDPALTPETLLPVRQPVSVDVAQTPIEPPIQNPIEHPIEHLSENDRLEAPQLSSIVPEAQEPLPSDLLPKAIVADAVPDEVEKDEVEDENGAVDPLKPNDLTDLSVFQEQKNQLAAEIADLRQQRESLTLEVNQLQSTLGQLVPEALQELRERKRNLQEAVERLERRQERIQAEMRQNFAGVSQDLAIRVKSFKEYLVGSLQDLVVTAEDLNLVPPAPTPIVTPVDSGTPGTGKKAATPQFGDDGFKEQTREIRRLLDQYRTSPDYYGPPWQLRRTFEPVHAERVSNWFFEQGGRGAIRGLGTRLQNVLIASAAISVLNEFYGEQLITLVLANTPESLGEWRRGLQDCLGISRADFGPNQGVALYEDPEPLVQRADRLVQAGDLPLVIIDEAEGMISLSLLQFPLWLAFAADPRNPGERF